MMSSPAGATASPVASQHKIGSFRFKSSSDSLRITELLEQNVAAVDKVLVQYNILFPKHSSLFFSDFQIPPAKYLLQSSRDDGLYDFAGKIVFRLS